MRFNYRHLKKTVNIASAVSAVGHQIIPSHIQITRHVALVVPRWLEDVPRPFTVHFRDTSNTYEGTESDTEDGNRNLLLHNRQPGWITEAPCHKKFDEITSHADVTVGEEVCVTLQKLQQHQSQLGVLCSKERRSLTIMLMLGRESALYCTQRDANAAICQPKIEIRWFMHI